MKAFIVILIIIAVICGGLYFLFSSTQQVDVAWTEQDYKSYLQKMAAAETAGQATGSTTEGQNSKEGGNTKEQNGTDSSSDTGKTDSKPFPVEASFTSAEISAMVSKECAATNAPVKDVRIKFLAGNKLEASFVTTEKMKKLIPQRELEKYKIAENLIANRPVYVRMQIDKASSNTIDLNLEGAKVGQVGIPTTALEAAENAIESAVNSQFGKLSNFSIDQLNFDENNASFKGNLQSVPRKLN